MPYEQFTTSVCTKSRDERIATLEAEIFNLKKAREAAPKQPTVPISKFQLTVPAHPYRNARNTAYTPPVDRNVAVPDKPNNGKRPEPAYKTLPPVHDPTIAANAYKRSMDAPITITQRELLSISPEVRSQYKDSTTTRRIPYNNGTTAQNIREIETEDCDNQQLLATVTDIQPTYAILLTEESTKNTSVPSIIIPDITISPPLTKQFNSQEDQLQSNVSDIGTEADYNISITDTHSIYLPINTDKRREFTDKQLPIVKHLSTDSQAANQQPISTNSNQTYNSVII